MPLDDALSFMAKNFDAYLRSLQNPVGYSAQQPAPVTSATGYLQPHSYHDNRRAPPPPAPHHAPAPAPTPAPAPAAAAAPAPTAASEKQMSTEEIEAMIEKLKREKEQREAAAKQVAPGTSIEDPYASTSATVTAAPVGGAYAYEKYTPANTPAASNANNVIPPPATPYYPPTYR